jgi:hypothetical protein
MRCVLPRPFSALVEGLMTSTWGRGLADNGSKQNGPGRPRNPRLRKPMLYPLGHGAQYNRCIRQVLWIAGAD